MHQRIRGGDEEDPHEDVETDADPCEREEALEEAQTVQPPVPSEEVLLDAVVDLVHLILLTIYYENVLIVAYHERIGKIKGYR